MIGKGSEVPDGFVAPDEAMEQVTIRLGEVDETDPTIVTPIRFDDVFTDGALETILQTIGDALYAPQLTNYYVAFDPADLDPGDFTDRRPGSRTDLGILVTFDGPYLPISSFELEYIAGQRPELPDVPVEVLAQHV